MNTVSTLSKSRTSNVELPAAASEATEHVTVVIIGGFGMQEKHLEIFRKFHSRLGATDVKLVCLPFTALTLPPLIKRSVRRLQQELSQDDGQVLYHVFSGAIWLYLYFNRMADDALRARSRGVIFESTPVEDKPGQFGRYLAWRLKRRYHPIFALPFVLYRRIVFAWPRWHREVKENFERLDAALKVLFVYSENDPIADPDAIERYADRLRDRSLEIMNVRLPRARHCMAIRDQNRVYRCALSDFFKRSSVMS